MRLRPAIPSDLALLRMWDERPHVVESDPHDDWENIPILLNEERYL